MSFAGHVIDMINRSKFNRSQMLARKDKIRKIRENHSDSSWTSNPVFLEKKLPLKQLEKIKSDIRKKIKRESQRSIIYTLIVLLTLFAIVLILVRHFSKIN